MKKKKLYVCPVFCFVKIDTVDVLTASNEFCDEFDAKDYNLKDWW